MRSVKCARRTVARARFYKKNIGSMYGIYGNIYHQYTPNVSIYTSTMDPMEIRSNKHGIVPIVSPAPTLVDFVRCSCYDRGDAATLLAIAGLQLEVAKHIVKACKICAKGSLSPCATLVL